MKIKLREGLAVSKVGKVDRDTCTIHDVKVCGVKSANGRRYSAKALQEAAKLYEGTRVFFDHPEGESNVRKFRERFGRLVNVKPDVEGGLTADLKYNPKHTDAESFLWLAANDPAGMGLSHNAEGQGIREASGDVLVERITKVHSVDIVDGPATNLSLFEQDSSMDPVTDPKAGATDSGDQDVNAKLAALASDFAAHPEWDKKTKLEKLKGLVNLMEDNESDDEQSEDDKEPSDDEMMEQLGAFKSKAVVKAKKILAREQAKKFAVAKGLKPELITDVFVEQIAGAPVKLREAIVKDRIAVTTAAGAETPRQAPPTGSDPEDVKKLAEKTWGLRNMPGSG